MEEFLPNAEYPMGQRDGDQKQGEPRRVLSSSLSLWGLARLMVGKEAQNRQPGVRWVTDFCWQRSLTWGRQIRSINVLVRVDKLLSQTDPNCSGSHTTECSSFSPNSPMTVFHGLCSPQFFRDPGWALALPSSTCSLRRASNSWYFSHMKWEDHGGPPLECFMGQACKFCISLPYIIPVDKTSAVSTTVVGQPYKQLLLKTGGAKVGEYMALTATEGVHHKNEAASRSWLRGFSWEHSNTMQCGECTAVFIWCAIQAKTSGESPCYSAILKIHTAY